MDRQEKIEVRSVSQVVQSCECAPRQTAEDSRLHAIPGSQAHHCSECVLPQIRCHADGGAQPGRRCCRNDILRLAEDREPPIADEWWQRETQRQPFLLAGPVAPYSA